MISEQREEQREERLRDRRLETLRQRSYRIRR